MEQNKFEESSSKNFILYLFIFLFVIVALVYYRIYIRHDYYVTSSEGVGSNAVESGG